MSHVGRAFLFDYGAMAIRVYTTWTAAGGTLAAFQGPVS
jgi:hypothetical protein